MARDWAAVADAMKARLTDLDMTQADLVQRSHLAPMTIRELLYNSAQRRRSDQTLAALSQALGWPPGHLQAVAEGRTLKTRRPTIRCWPSWPRMRDALAALTSRIDAIERQLADGGE